MNSTSYAKGVTCLLNEEAHAALKRRSQERNLGVTEKKNLTSMSKIMREILEAELLPKKPEAMTNADAVAKHPLHDKPLSIA
jgi:hypothetical protein